MSNCASLNHMYRSVWNQALGAMVAVAEIATACCGAASSAQAQALPAALPSGGVAIHGSAAFNTTQPNKLVVTTQNGAGTSHSAINWNSFSIGAGKTTQFVQPGASSMSINRVVTNTPSELFGTLSSNGRLVLVNQSGIAVGAGAVVDTAGFTASALSMSEADAIAGRLRFGGAGFADYSGVLTVQGNLIARGGDVVLIAPNIDLAKTAVVEAEGGSVMLAAGQGVEVTGRGLEGITMQVQAPADKAVNLGTLRGDAVGIFAGNLKHSGSIQANAISAVGGKVVLKAKDHLEIDGQVLAQGLGGMGGTVHATADKVWLKNGTVIDVSSANGGGEVLIGGGWHGEDARLSNAMRTQVSSGAHIKADALGQGNAGTVAIWSDGATGFLGQISAQGGPLGGDGGNVEVSGKQFLDFRGSVSTTAAFGNAGLLLLDPNSIDVGLVADLNGDSTLGDDVTGSYVSGGVSKITAAAVSAILNSNSLSLDAAGDIMVNAAINKSSGSLSTLTLLAGGNLDINAGISSANGSPLNLAGSAGGAVTTNASGAITLGASSVVNLTAGTGNVTINAPIAPTAGGPLSVTLTSNSGSVINHQPISTLGGNITLVSNGGSGVSITNNGTLSSFGGDVTMDANLGTVNVAGIIDAQSGNISIAGTNGVQLGANISTTSTAGGPTTVALDITTSGGGLINQTSGAISATGVGSLVQAHAGASDISMTSAGNNFTNLSLTGGHLTVVDVNALNITSMTYGANKNVYLEAGGALTLPAGPIVTTAQLSLFSGTTLTTPGVLSGSTVMLEAPGGLTLAYNVTASGNLTLLGGATSGVDQVAGAISAPSGLTSVSASSGQVNLNQSGNNFSSITVTAPSGSVQLRDATGFALGNVSASALDVNSSSGGGAITQLPGTTIASAATTFNTGGGAVTLTNSGNSLGSFQTTGSNAGAVNLTNGAGSLSLNLINAGLLNVQTAGNVSINNNITTPGAVAIQSTGGSISQPDAATVNAATIKLKAATGLTVDGGLNASAGGNSIELASTTGLFSSDVTASVTVGSGGRWLIYLDDPAAAHNFGLTYAVMSASDFRQYGAPYGTAPLGSGNGTLFAVVPVLTLYSPLAGSVTKAYDGTTSISMSGVTFSSLDVQSGLLFGDQPVYPGGASITGPGTLASPNVGTGILVTVTNGTVTGIEDTDTHSVAYGYKINASGNIGTVTPAGVAPVSLAGLRTYDGTNIVNASIFSLSGLAGNETLTLTGSGTVADKNVGARKPVSLGSLALGNGTGLASNYTLSGGTHVATILPAVISGITGLTAQNKVYDGTTKATLVTSSAAFPGLVRGDSLSVASATGDFADKNAGAGKLVSISGISLSGADVGNYTFNPGSVSTSADISKAVLESVSGIAASNKVYDGTAVATLGFSSATLPGLVNGDDVFVASATGRFADKNVGVGKSVNISEIILAGIDASNYSLSSKLASAKADVSPALITSVSGIVAKDKTYDGTAAASLVTSSAVLAGLIAGDDVSVNGATGAFIDKNAGIAKTVNISGIGLTGIDAPNYKLENTSAATNAEISKASTISVNGITASNKIYDGTTTANLGISSATLHGFLEGDRVLLAGVTGTFEDKNVGVGRIVNITDLTLTGPDAANYSFANSAATVKADITARPLSTWTGSGGGLWSSPLNWDVLPTANNVLGVVIPPGSGSIVFDSIAGATSLQSLTSQRPLVVNGGSLSVASSLSIPGLTQSAGTLIGAGSLNIASSLSQTGGSIVMAGNVVANQSSGDMLVGTMRAPAIALSAQAGLILQSGPLTTPSLQTASSAGTILTNSNNKIARFMAGNTGSGGITLNNSVPLEIAGITNTRGEVVINNVGGITTTGPIFAPKEAVHLIANSPLTIGEAGIAAGGDITLAATNLSSLGDLTLNGPVTSDGAVSLNAANNMMQNGAVFGAKGVSASAGGKIIFGPFATTGKDPIVYSSGGSSMSTPVPAAAKSSSAGDVIVTFLDLFDKAVENQKEEIFITRSDGTTRRRNTSDAITSEGEICRP